MGTARKSYFYIAPIVSLFYYRSTRVSCILLFKYGSWNILNTSSLSSIKTIVVKLEFRDDEGTECRTLSSTISLYLSSTFNFALLALRFQIKEFPSSSNNSTLFLA